MTSPGPIAAPPEGFDGYWEAVDDELRLIPAQPVLEPGRELAARLGRSS